MTNTSENWRTSGSVPGTPFVPAVSALFAFWAGMLMAARHYPGDFDWRYITVSSLIYPAHNPSGHLWASAGIVVCGVCGVWWATTLARGWFREGPAGHLHGVRALWLGNICMACSAILPPWLLPVRKGHELLAIFAFVGLCVGIVLVTFHITEGLLQRRMAGASRFSRLCAVAASVAAVLPIFLAGLAQAYTRYALPELRWVSLSWRAQGVPAYLSFAFWEWFTCFVLSAYLVALSLAAQVKYSPIPANGGELGSTSQTHLNQ